MQPTSYFLTSTFHISTGNGVTLYPNYYHFIFLQNVNIGVISSIEVNHKQVETARKGQEVCIKIENVGSDAPKMVGRHFDVEDLLVSKVYYYSSIDCSNPC